MFHYKFKFSWIGLIIFILPMLINIVFFMVHPAEEMQTNKQVNRMIEMVEQVTRMLYAIEICILVSTKKIEVKSPYLYLGIVFLVLYYIVWIRDFAGGMKTELMCKSFMFVPIPLAVFPVLYFIFAALWLHNGLAVITMCIFGIAHYIVSVQSFAK